MRLAGAVLLLAFLAAPAAGAATPRLVDPPAVAPLDGTAFLVEVALAGEPGERFELLARWGPGERSASRTWNGTGWDRADRYVVAGVLDADGAWRGNLTLAANPTSANRAAFLAGPDELLVRVRGGGEARAPLAPADLAVVPVRGPHPLAGVPGALPALAGVAWVATEAPPEPPPSRLVEVVPRGPVEAVVVDAAGGPLCVRTGARTQCVDAAPDARLVLADAGYAELAGEAVDAPLDLDLADAGGEVALLWGSAVVDRLAWPRVAPGATVAADGSTSRMGRTHLPAIDFRADGGLAFVDPDGGFAALASVVEASTTRIDAAVYTLSSPEVAGVLADAARRGVAVRVLVDADPVGGVSPESRACLATLVEAGVEVLAMGGPGRRYATMHAKVLVADGGTVLVGTDNWNPQALPADGDGRTRGHGLVVASRELGAALTGVLDADARGADVRAWVADVEPMPPAPYPRPRVTGVALGPFDGRLLLAPDNALPEVLAAVDGAEREVLAAALRLDPDWPPLSDAYAEAAARGVDVRVLLAAPPQGQDNARAAADLVARGVAAAVESSPDVGLLHTKTWVVDGTRVLVGSLNGNRASAEDNREVVLDVASAEAAAFFRASLLGDMGEEATVPAAGATSAGVAVLAVAWMTRRRWSPTRAATALGGEGTAFPGPRPRPLGSRRPRPSRAPSSRASRGPWSCTRWRVRGSRSRRASSSAPPRRRPSGS